MCLERADGLYDSILQISKLVILLHLGMCITHYSYIYESCISERSRTYFRTYIRTHIQRFTDSMKN